MLHEATQVGLDQLPNISALFLLLSSTLVTIPQFIKNPNIKILKNNNSRGEEPTITSKDHERKLVVPPKVAALLLDGETITHFINDQGSRTDVYETKESPSVLPNGDWKVTKSTDSASFDAHGQSKNLRGGSLVSLVLNSVKQKGTNYIATPGFTRKIFSGSDRR